MDLVEQTFSIHGKTFSGLRWQHTHASDAASKVLCLHGWLDNAASFLALAPLLDAAEIVAIDLAGHGHTDHRSDDASYNVWEDLEEIIAIADALGWQTFHLLGHSRGGTIAVQLAAVMPERIQQLVLLDSLFMYHKFQPYVDQLRQYLVDRKRYSRRKNRVFSTLKDAVKQRLDGGMTVLQDSEVTAMVERNLKTVEGGFSWRYDNRLRGASAVKLVDDFVDSILSSLCVPTLMIAARDGSLLHPELKQYIHNLKSHQWIELIEHDGAHHLHMEAAHVNAIAKLINQRLVR